MTKERPILFSGPMVRAILENRKTQTRRVIKPQPLIDPRDGCWYPKPPDQLTMTARDPKRRCLHYANDAHFRRGMPFDFSPYGQPCDTLWVKQGFRAHRLGGDPGGETFGVKGSGVGIEYRDTPGHGCNFDRPDWREAFRHERWRSSLMMPRWASCVSLLITDVRVQRVQDISEEDAIAEGLEAHSDDGVMYYGPFDRGHCDPRTAFRNLWDSINEQRGFGWGANPFVWAITFEVVRNA